MFLGLLSSSSFPVRLTARQPVTVAPYRDAHLRRAALPPGGLRKAGLPHNLSGPWRALNFAGSSPSKRMTRFMHTFRTPSGSSPLRTSAPHGRALYSAPLPTPRRPSSAPFCYSCFASRSLLLRPQALHPQAFCPGYSALLPQPHIAATHPYLPQLPSEPPPMHNYPHTIPTSTRRSNGASAASSSSVSPLSAPFSRRYRRAGMISANAARKRGLPPAALLARRSGCRCSWPLQHRLRPRRRRLH